MDDADARVLEAQVREARQDARLARYERDEARKHIKVLNKTVGRQGDTICHLRGDLARVREDHSKIERGQLHWLERQVEMLRDQHEMDVKRLEISGEQNQQLIEELHRSGEKILQMTAELEESKALEIAEDGEYQDRDGSWHPFKLDRWRKADEVAQEPASV